MTAQRMITRRSFLAKVAGGAAGGALVMVHGGTALAYQCSDSDTGTNADPRYSGRACQQIGCSDHDQGLNRDPSRQGRRCHRYSGCSDRDPLQTGDAVGYGRSCRNR